MRVQSPAGSERTGFGPAHGPHLSNPPLLEAELIHPTHLTFMIIAGRRRSKSPYQRASAGDFIDRHLTRREPGVRELSAIGGEEVLEGRRIHNAVTRSREGSEPDAELGSTQILRKVVITVPHR